MRLKFLNLLLISAVFAASSARCEPERSLRIGVVLALTGAAALHGNAIRDGLELARRELESEGWQIVLDFQDDRTKSIDSVSSFKLMLDQGYRYFIGPTWDFQVEAVKSIFSKHEAITFVPSVSADTAGGLSKHMVYICPPRSNQIPVLSSFLKYSLREAAGIATVESGVGIEKSGGKL